MYVVQIPIHINGQDLEVGQAVSPEELFPYVPDLLAQKAIAPAGHAAVEPEPEKEEPREPVL